MTFFVVVGIFFAGAACGAGILMALAAMEGG